MQTKSCSLIAHSPTGFSPSALTASADSNINDLKVPLIRWDKDCAAHTTCLITWLKENESAHIKIFSDSMQDARDSNWRKEVIFANDDDEDVQHFSQVCPDLFVRKIDRHIKDLRKAYNTENKRLGQTDAGRTYEELQHDPSKVNLLDTFSILWHECG
ncbi:hypothetical protein HD554DRAFT_2038723 [Boletus coccyginus]|nr:hypothetical protein HD554DRAFT_2038723 [Boletus coccyginus]